MEIFGSLPALARILAVFVLILGAIRKKVSLGNAFCLGAAVLGLLFGLNPLEILRSAFFSFLDSKTLSLTVVVCLILVLSHSLEKSGQMDRLLDRFRGLVGHPGVNLVIFPALIGLLPMPGGAVFSAPMVKTLGQGRLSGARLSYVNYWFRHVWEYWWPLYPGVLLTTTLADIDLWVFVPFLFPLTLVALTAGYWPLRGLKDSTRDEPSLSTKRSPAGPFLRELFPILLVIALGLGLGSLFSLVLKPYQVVVGKELGLIAALVVAIFWVWSFNGLSRTRRWEIVAQRQLARMFYMVSAILIFKGILQDSHAVEVLGRELMSRDIPLVPVTIFLPMLVGGVAGITIAFVGTTFPILISLVHGFGETPWMLSYMMLALASGFVGVLLSPLHLCLLLSNEYFGTSLEPVYRYLWLPCFVLLASSIFYFGLLHHFLH